MMDEKNLEDRNLDCECEREAEKKDHTLRSAFYNAAVAGNTSVVKNLLEAGINPQDCFDVLRDAAGKGRMETLKFILPKIDSLPECQTRRMVVAAAENGHMETVRAILDWVDQKNVTTPSSQLPPQPQGPGA